ncbi:MAG TPA: glycosyltransferase family protein [Coriobacteriia bacterium]|nr:glycosyltransferase family protein [Coriobacteriia bacterium]
MRTGAVIQARMSSTRLPGKVLKPLPYGGDATVLERIIVRLRRARSLDAIVVATSTSAEDDLVEAATASAGVPCYRGPLDDVVRRYLGAAEAHGLDRIVRITADCPCADPSIVDAVVDFHESAGADFTSNVLPRSFPKGLDVEVADIAVLRAIDAEAVDRADREHVFTYAYLTRPERFRIANLTAPRALTDPDLRVTIDTTADYAMVSALFDLLGSAFDTASLLSAVAEHPWLRLVNPG